MNRFRHLERARKDGPPEERSVADPRRFRTLGRDEPEPEAPPAPAPELPSIDLEKVLRADDTPGEKLLRKAPWLLPPLFGIAAALAVAILIAIVRWLRG